MLSNKLTFSLVLVLVFAFVAIPAMAQTNVAIANAPTKGFPFAVVVTAASTAQVSVPTGFPAVNETLTLDLHDILRFGGTIELQLMPAALGEVTANEAAGIEAADAKTAADRAEELATANAIALNLDDDPAAATDAQKQAGAWHDFVISEIMWGLNAEDSTTQYVEIYNNSGENLRVVDANAVPAVTAAAALRLVIYPGRSTADIGAAQPTDPTADPLVNAWVIVDRVRAVNKFGSAWNLPGQSGKATAPTATDTRPQANIISMYRTHDLNANGVGYKSDTVGNGKHWNDGTDGGSWAETPTHLRRNIDGADAAGDAIARWIVGTPYSTHLAAAGGGQEYTKAPDALPIGTVIINEVYNSDTDRLDWIELHNTSEDTAVSVKDWEISFVTAIVTDDTKDDGAVLPDYEIPAMGYLLVVATDPSETILAAGIEVPENESDLLGGAQHMYHVDDKVMMPSGKFMIVLRNGDDEIRNHGKVVDAVGAIFGTIADNGTEVWPLRGWAAPGDLADFGDTSFSGGAWARSKSEGNRFHKDHWAKASNTGGVGYDPKVSSLDAMGTPGYPNAALKMSALKQDETTKAYSVIDGVSVIISEIMYDAGEDGDTPQWIELYNPSLTHAVDLSEMTLEVRNKDSAESYVDSEFMFAENTTILPNQTLLLVSYRGPNDVPARRTYNLWQHHKDDLGLLQRRSILLSPAGFYLKLSYEQENNPMADDDDMVVVDEAGNVTVDGAARTVNWDLEDAGRTSLIRKKDAMDGTAEDSWRMADGVTTFYGDRNDMGSPGDHKGSPLPVSLSSFRPVRDKATGQVVITWVTESELNNAGFNILRAEGTDGDFQKVNVKLIAGHGTTSEKHVYSYTDTTAKPNVVYYYQIEDISLDGKHTTLRTTHLRGNVNAAGKLTTTWGDLKLQR